ncbi:MAG: STAS domain-containing protein [Candidatus Eisenbacteria bacterium]
MLELRVEPAGVVIVKGRLDAAESDRALAALAALPGPLTLDCSQMEYISSAGISVIMQTWKRLAAQGSSLKLVGLIPRVRSVFAYAGLDRVLDIQ